MWLKTTAVLLASVFATGFLFFVFMTTNNGFGLRDADEQSSSSSFSPRAVLSMEKHVLLSPSSTQPNEKAAPANIGDAAAAAPDAPISPPPAPSPPPVTLPSSSSSSSSFPYPFRFPSLLADFSSVGGEWVIQPNTSHGNEPVRHWAPSTQREMERTEGERSAPTVSKLHAKKVASCDVNSNADALSIKRGEGVAGKGDGGGGVSSSFSPSPFRPWRRFDQLDALQCLSGKKILFVGNSNTRTLMTALQSLLDGIPQMSRVSAKQQCDNSKFNHSCWLTVLQESSSNAVEEGKENLEPFDIPANVNISKGVASIIRERIRKVREDKNEGNSFQNSHTGGVSSSLLSAAARSAVNSLKTIQLHYVSYVGGLFTESEMEERIATPYFKGAEKTPDNNGVPRRPADIIIMNVGLNFLQKYWDDVWREEHKKNREAMVRFIRRYLAFQSSTSSSSDGQGRRARRRGVRYGDAGQETVKRSASFPSNSHPPLIDSLVSSYPRQHIDGPVFFWHSTTPLCRPMGHFHRYKYRKSNWQGRSLENTNAAIEESNAFVARKVLAEVAMPETVADDRGALPPLCPQSSSSSSSLMRSEAASSSFNPWDRVVFIDSHAMLSPADLTTPSAVEKAKRVKMNRHSSSPHQQTAERLNTGAPGTMDDVCNLYDDPLHHRFFDRELVQVILNHYC